MVAESRESEKRECFLLRIKDNATRQDVLTLQQKEHIIRLCQQQQKLLFCVFLKGVIFMSLNGDAVVSDSSRKANRVAQKILSLMVVALQKSAGAIESKLQQEEVEKEKQKLMESYGVTKEFQKYMAEGG